MDIQSKAKDALDAIPADIARDEWVRVATSLKTIFGNDGLVIFDQWSRTSEKYRPQDVKDTWRSVVAGVVGPGTLIYIARQYGYRPTALTRSEQRFLLDSMRKLKHNNNVVSMQNSEKRERQQEIASLTAIRELTPFYLPDEDHPYLVRKHLKDNKWIARKAGLLLVPMADIEGKIWNVQKIFPDGKKLFIKSGKVTGCFCRIGNLNQIIYICEGYATGQTLHMVTGEAVACAMNAGNLKPVALSIAKKYPSAKIIIAGDNDRKTTGNPGLSKAREAVKAIGCKFIFPEFKDDQEGTDFNDLAILRGDI
jgi:putative DNA primase/helicase